MPFLFENHVKKCILVCLFFVVVFCFVLFFVVIVVFLFLLLFVCLFVFCLFVFCFLGGGGVDYFKSMFFKQTLSLFPGSGNNYVTYDHK